jgi:CRISPR/Cas system-associated exonuclease Cas4 (RecB family)
VTDEYNPAQQQVIDLLGRTSGVPTFPVNLGASLLNELEAELAPLSDLIADEKLWISKRTLASLHGCEANYLATDENFEWSIPVVRGMVSHKAIELGVHWNGEAPPRTLVDEAVARIIDGDRPAGKFLQTLGEGDQAQLRSEAAAHVSAFQECFPPLKAAWIPVMESTSRVELMDGRVVLSGKVDLTLGRPGAKVIIDLKSGWVATQHREDLRFYALVEAMKLGQPPRKVATYYLDTARAHAEDVTEHMLDAALRRTAVGVRKAAELRAGVRPPIELPGPNCKWCPLNTTCATGIDFLAKADNDTGW